ncbi:hypothetical protein ACOSQ4_011302 [Xanthoceras sorbifolium]
MFKIYIKEVRKLVGEKRTINITANSPFIVAASSDDIANTYFLIHTEIFQYNVSANTDLLVNSASNFLQDLKLQIKVVEERVNLSFHPTEVAYKVIVNRVLRDFINRIFY